MRTAGAPSTPIASRAKDVFVASHVPINKRVLLQTKIAAYRTYAMAFDVTGASPLGEQALFWDTDSPYHYTRVHAVAGRTCLIVGGEDHRTGSDDDTELHFTRVEDCVEARFGRLPLRYRWSGQILESVDGLPFIGLNSGGSHVYVATGYSGNGMTHGTAAHDVEKGPPDALPSGAGAVFESTEGKVPNGPAVSDLAPARVPTSQ